MHIYYPIVLYFRDLGDISATFSERQMQYEDDDSMAVATSFKEEENTDFYDQDHDIIDDSSYTNETTTDDNTAIAKQKKRMNDYKNLDKGYRKIDRVNNNKKIKIELYVTSCTPGTKIRDAITGNRFKSLFVGKSDEDYFFKVKLATGELGPDGGHLYYETPSRCEEHLKITIPDLTKKRWTDKYEDYCKINKM